MGTQRNTTDDSILAKQLASVASFGIDLEDHIADMASHRQYLTKNDPYDRLDAALELVRQARDILKGNRNPHRSTERK